SDQYGDVYHRESRRTDQNSTYQDSQTRTWPSRRSYTIHGLPPSHHSITPILHPPLLHHSSSSANQFDHRQCITPGPHRQKNRVAMLATHHNDHNIFGRGGEMYDSVRRHVRRFP